MSVESFAAVLPHLLRHEGGFVDHPRDPGGATKYGITRATLSDWRGRSVTRTDVRRLTRAEAGAIYRSRYWDAVRGDDLPAGVDYCVFDAAVHSGPGRAAAWLQAAVRVPQDGAIGPVTLSAAGDADPGRVIGDICAVRLAFLHGLSTWPVFGRGWERRVEAVRRTALAMAASGGPDERPDARSGDGDGRPRWRGPLAALAALLRAILTGGRR